MTWSWHVWYELPIKTLYFCETFSTDRRGIYYPLCCSFRHLFDEFYNKWHRRVEFKESLKDSLTEIRLRELYRASLPFEITLDFRKRYWFVVNISRVTGSPSLETDRMQASLLRIPLTLEREMLVCGQVTTRPSFEIDRMEHSMRRTAIKTKLPGNHFDFVTWKYVPLQANTHRK